MEAGIPGLEAVREAHPSELAVLLSTVSVDDVRGMSKEACEAVVVATQKVASWAHAMQAATVDRFAELVTDDVEVHVAELAAERETRRASGLSTQAVVPVPEPDAIAASSLAPLLNIAPRTMRTRLNRARLLVELPQTFTLALEGVLEPWRVDGVVVAARDVAVARVAEFEARLYADDVSRLPKPCLVARAQRAAVKADPDGSERARRVAPRRRGVRFAPSEVPGLMRWTADVPDEQSRHLVTAIDALAQEYLMADADSGVLHHGVRRTVEAARLDALVDLVMADARVETLVEIVLPVATALPPLMVQRPDPRDVIRSALAAPPGRGPASGGGVTHSGADLALVDPLVVDLVAGSVTHDTLAAGWVERSLGRDLGEHLEVAGNPFLSSLPPPGAHHRWRPLEAIETQRVWFVDGIVEARGTTGLLPSQVVAILEHPDTRLRVSAAEPGSADGPPGRRRTYRPGRALAAKVRARDLHCRFPGCSVPAQRCHLDHVIAYPDGGTHETNLQCLCPAHHGFKHHAGWTVTMTDDGTCTWTAPTGRSHPTSPGSARTTAA